MILVAGATGFVGRHLLEVLKEHSFRVRCLVRDKRRSTWIEDLGFEALPGDITDASSLRGALDGVTTVVHLVGIIEEKGTVTFEGVHVEGTGNLVEEAVQSGVKQIFYQSALGADPGSSHEYLRTKAEAERIVSSSGIPYAIFRPSLIVGRGDGFTLRIMQLLKAGPVVPVPGKGEARFQPLHISDWIKCFMKVMEKPFRNRIYAFGGPEQLTYNEILGHIMSAVGIKKRIVHLPVGAVKMALPFMGIANTIARMMGREIPPVNEDILALLGEDNICGTDSIREQFGFEPMPFTEALTMTVETG